MPQTGVPFSVPEETRFAEPERVGELLATRRRRTIAGGDGRLMIVACDHPARGALGASGNATAMADRAELLGTGHGGTGRRVLGGPAAPETARTRELDNDGVLQLQKDEMAAQDEQVRALAAIIRRQKELGLEIQGEVTMQNEMLKVVDDDLTRVTNKTAVANNRLRKMGRGD